MRVVLNAFFFSSTCLCSEQDTRPIRKLHLDPKKKMRSICLFSPPLLPPSPPPCLKQDWLPTPIYLKTKSQGGNNEFWGRGERSSPYPPPPPPPPPSTDRKVKHELKKKKEKEKNTSTKKTHKKTFQTPCKNFTRQEFYTVHLRCIDSSFPDMATTRTTIRLVFFYRDARGC